VAGCNHDIGAEQLKIVSFERALWAVLMINIVMFFAEFSSAFVAGSVALQADALDFLGDAATYAITLMVLGSSIRVRAGAAMLKGVSMGMLGIWVFVRTAFNVMEGSVPLHEVMWTMGIIAFVANVVSALILYRYRGGDSNMRSVWLCSRNDAIGNLAIIVAASGVFVLSSGWPDFIVAVIMAVLALTASYQIIRQAYSEMKNPETAQKATESKQQCH
jgi:Co/Zn/Cd efflux system component